MSSLNQSFVERNAAFVIKLKLVGLGAAPQIRRVRLKSIATNHDSVSYDELIGLAIQFTFPNSSVEQLEDFDVTLTYYDTDNDCITLATTEELMDAIQQYSDGGSGTLRLTTDVRKKKTKHSSRSKDRRDSTSRALSSVSLTSTTPSEPAPAEATPSLYPAASTTPSSSSSNHQRINGPQVLEALLESFVSILAAAVVALQSHLTVSPTSASSTSASAASSTINETKAPSPVPAIEESQNASDVAEVVEPATVESTEEVIVFTPPMPEEPQQQQEPDIVVEPKVCNMPPPRQMPQPQPAATSVGTASVSATTASASTVPAAVTSAPSTNASSTPPAAAPTSTPPAAPATAATTQTEPEDRPFIHGRHTCDGCLCTPVVGKRYHATNLKDYDLCERCMENYKGTEIQFEPVELDRDRAFQERWHRRRQKWSQCHRPHGFNHHRHGPSERFGPPQVPPPHGPPHHRGPPPFHGPPHHHGPPHFHGPPHPHGPPHFHGPPHPHGPPPHPFGHMMPPMPPNPFGPPHCPGTANGAGNFEDALKEAIQRSLRDMMEKVASKPGEVTMEEPTPELVKETPTPVVVKMEPTLEVEKEIPAQVVVESEATLELAKETSTPVVVKLEYTCEPPSIETGDNNDDDDFSKGDVAVVTVDTKEVSTAASTEGEDESFSEGEEEVVVQADLQQDEEVASQTDVDVASEKADDGSLVENVDELVEEPSFSSDAAGNGDVAEALGLTFDQCAREIDAMVSELNRSEMRNTSHDDEDCESLSRHGATILESIEDETKRETKEDEEKSEDGWQVVTETHQVTDDEALARAAQFVGSALFNSDISARSAVMSTLSGSGGSFSTELSVPTVPSVVPSISPQTEESTIPTAQLQRWAVQLNQLHELGFYDDKTSIDILERISASNVGSDLYEEVTVTQVINDLLNTKMD